MALTNYVSNGNRDWDEVTAQAEAMVATLTMRGYPRARRLLVGQGMDADFVKELTPSQAVLIAGIIEFHQHNHDIIKWSFLPYHMAASGAREADRNIGTIPGDEDVVLGLAGMVSPAVQQILAAQARARRQTVVLQAVEAIRMYAANNGGKLPESMDDLRSCPIPNDPVTGKPLALSFEEKQISISGPPLPSGVLDVEITIVE